MTHLTWKETLLSLGSGVLTALAMPGFGAFPLIFFCLVPLFVVLERRKGIWPGLWFGISFFAIDLRWISTLSRFYPIVIAGYVILVLIFALGCGLLGALIVWRKRSSAWTWLVLAPAAFAIAEYLRTLGPLSLGFSTLYGSLYRVPLLIQSAAVFGPWFISAMLVAINGSLTLLVIRRRPRYVALAAVGVLLLSAFSLIPFPTSETSLDVAIVSSTVAQEEKLDGRNLPSLRDRYLDLGQQALETQAELIVFPESILPAYILQNESLKNDFGDLAQRADAAILLGTGVYRDRNIYNAVALFSPSGEIVDTYDMVRPVPFGEYIPGRTVLEWIGLGSWARSFLPLDLSRGEGYRPLSIYGTPICFESTFPLPARSLTRNGAQALVTVTNDAWFAESSELIAHFASAVFRAVENRRWVIQSANGGFSGIVSPSGNIEQILHTEGVLSGAVALQTELSLYTRWGDWFVLGISCLIALGFAATRMLIRKDNGGKIDDLAPE